MLRFTRGILHVRSSTRALLATPAGQYQLRFDSGDEAWRHLTDNVRWISASPREQSPASFSSDDYSSDSREEVCLFHYPLTHIGGSLSKATSANRHGSSTAMWPYQHRICSSVVPSFSSQQIIAKNSAAIICIASNGRARTLGMLRPSLRM